MLDLGAIGGYTVGVCGIGGSNMLSELSQAANVVGVKQSKKAIRDGNARAVFVADDAEQRVIRPIRELCCERNVPLNEVPTMVELGDAAGIDVCAAVVTLLKSAN